MSNRAGMNDLNDLLSAADSLFQVSTGGKLIDFVELLRASKSFPRLSHGHGSRNVRYPCSNSECRASMAKDGKLSRHHRQNPVKAAAEYFISRGAKLTLGARLAAGMNMK